MAIHIKHVPFGGCSAAMNTIKVVGERNLRRGPIEVLQKLLPCLVGRITSEKHRAAIVLVTDAEAGVIGIAVRTIIGIARRRVIRAVKRRSAFFDIRRQDVAQAGLRGNRRVGQLGRVGKHARGPLRVDVHGQGDADLPEIIAALQPPGRFARGLDRRQQQPDQQADDRDYHQQFDERKCRTPSGSKEGAGSHSAYR